jgi:hypothetical protein
MPKITQDQWLRLVEHQTGFNGERAVRPVTLEAVEAALDKADLSGHETAEMQATVVAELALTIFRLRPLRWWIRRSPGLVAAATAAEVLRTVGWAISPAELNRLGNEITRGESPAYLAVRLLAARVVPGPEALDAEVYLSVPVSNTTPGQRSLAASWGQAIEEELEALAGPTGLRLFMRAPGLHERDVSERRDLARSGLHRSVLHFVVGIGGGTPGIGIETHGSMCRRRPVIWLLPPGESAPQSIHSAAIEADVEIIEVPSKNDLPGIVRDRVMANLGTMRELLREKDTVPVALLELQEEMRKRWMRLDVTPENLATLRMGVERVNLLLLNPLVLYNEASVSEMDALASFLGIDIFIARKALMGGTRMAG